MASPIKPLHRLQQMNTQGTIQDGSPPPRKRGTSRATNDVHKTQNDMPERSQQPSTTTSTKATLKPFIAQKPLAQNKPNQESIGSTKRQSVNPTQD